MKIANSELLHGPFVYLEQASRRVRKIMQSYAKIHKNHRKMSTENYGSRFRNCKKYTPSLDVPERVKMRSLLLFTVLHCSGKVCRHHVNWPENEAKLRFLCMLLNASRSWMVSKCVHFATVCMDPTNFRIKILEISTLGAKCYLNVARSAPDMKIKTFCKVLPVRAQNANFHAFS